MIIIIVVVVLCVACSCQLSARPPRARSGRAPCGESLHGKTDSIHHHLLEVISETANVLESRQTFLYTTPSGWWWCIESDSDYSDLCLSLK